MEVGKSDTGADSAKPDDYWHSFVSYEWHDDRHDILEHENFCFFPYELGTAQAHGVMFLEHDEYPLSFRHILDRLAQRWNLKLVITGRYWFSNVDFVLSS